MSTEQNNQAGDVTTQTNEGEGQKTEGETVSISKADYDTLNQTLGSLKRELKDLKKPKEEATPQKTKPDEVRLLEKIETMSLRQAGITDAEDIDLARKTAQKWGVDIDEVIADEDFKVKLERQQTARANTVATSGVRGGAGTSQAKLTPEYWIAKGTPPTPSDVPDRKTRSKIVRAFIKSAKTSKTFYNE